MRDETGLTENREAQAFELLQPLEPGHDHQIEGIVFDPLAPPTIVWPSESDRETESSRARPTGWCVRVGFVALTLMLGLVGWMSHHSVAARREMIRWATFDHGQEAELASQIIRAWVRRNIDDD